MTVPSRAALERECRSFTRYLVGCDPSPYVIGKYCDAHVTRPVFHESPFDTRMVALARRHPATTLLADAYARFFAPRGALRKKLVLVLAILESAPPYFHALDGPPPGRRVLQACRIGVRLLVFALALLLGAMLLLPIRLLTPGRDVRP
jgi:hypothetical protein